MDRDGRGGGGGGGDAESLANGELSGKETPPTSIAWMGREGRWQV